MKESISITKSENNKNVGYGYADSGGKEISADIDKDAAVKHKFVGPPIRNRENEVNVAKILVDKINLPEKLYEDPVSIEDTDDIADCISYGIDNKKLMLKIQIVNSYKDNKYWERIAKTGSHKSTTNILDITDQIMKTVEDKSRKYGKDTVKDIVLALDATNNPQHSLTDVITEIRNNYYEKISNSGFLQIWIVGPNVNMTNRIYPDS